MVLNHVPNHARAIVVTGSMSNPDRLADRNLHMIQVVPVPQGLENRVRKAECQQILRRFFAQVVIVPKHLPLVEDSVDRVGQTTGDSLVATEGLLHNHPRPFSFSVQTTSTKAFDDRPVE